MRILFLIKKKLKQILIITLIIIIISLSSNQYIGFKFKKNNKNLKYLDYKRVVNNPRIKKIGSSKSLKSKQNKALKYSNNKTKNNKSKSSNLNHGIKRKYLYYNTKRIPYTKKNILIQLIYNKYIIILNKMNIIY